MLPQGKGGHTQHNTTTTYSKYSPEFSIQKRKKKQKRESTFHLQLHKPPSHLHQPTRHSCVYTTHYSSCQTNVYPFRGSEGPKKIISFHPKPVKAPPLKLIHAAAPLPLLILWSTTCQHLRPFGTRNMHNTLQDRLLILLHSIHCPPRTTRCAVPRTFRDSIAWRIHAVYVISIITAITQDRPFIILGLEAASAQARWAVPA